MTKETQTILRHALATLPDSIEHRLTLLNAVRTIAPQDSDERTQANLLIEQLKEHERTQMAFPFGPAAIKTAIDPVMVTDQDIRKFRLRR